MNLAETFNAFYDGEIPQDVLLRAIVAYQHWYIRSDYKGKPYINDSPLGDKWIYVSTGDDPQYTELKDRWLEIEGITLIRTYVEHYKLEFQVDDAKLAYITRTDQASYLLALADSIELERGLIDPSDAQPDIFLNHAWIVLELEGTSLSYLPNLQLIRVFTNMDRLVGFFREDLIGFINGQPNYKLGEVRTVFGRTLFAELAERTDYDGILINRGTAASQRVLGPNFARLLMQGQVMDDALQEQTEISCAGVLALWLRNGLDKLAAGPQPDVPDCPDDPDGFIARMDPHDSNFMEWVDEAVRLANYLEHLLDPQTDTIPRTAILTPKGSHVTREHSELLTGAWIRAARTRALEIGKTFKTGKLSPKPD